MSMIIKKLIKVFLYITSMFGVRDEDTIKPTWDSEDLKKSTDIFYKMLKDTVKEYLWPIGIAVAAITGIVIFLGRV